MDITAYMDQVYQWLQRFYTQETLENLVSGLRGWLTDITPERVGKMLLWTVIAAVAVDLILYWTRTDQVSLIRRLWRGTLKLWNRLTVKQHNDIAAE